MTIYKLETTDGETQRTVPQINSFRCAYTFIEREPSPVLLGEDALLVEFIAERSRQSMDASLERLKESRAREGRMVDAYWAEGSFSSLGECPSQYSCSGDSIGGSSSSSSGAPNAAFDMPERRKQILDEWEHQNLQS